jgi:hypothetical protein
MTSKWVPWEIGVADQIKKIDKIAIVPFEDMDGKFHGNEYLQLYPRIDDVSFQTQTILKVFQPNEYSNGTHIRSWFLGGYLWKM